MASNFTVTWGFFFLRQIFLQQRTQNDDMDPVCNFELHPTDVRYAVKIEARISVINDAIRDYNNICSNKIALSSSAPRTGLFCIITGYSTSIRLDTDNIGELSDFRQSILATSMYIVPARKFDVPERIMNRSLARTDSFDFVDRPARAPTSFRFGTDGDTSLTFTPEEDVRQNRNNFNNEEDIETTDDELHNNDNPNNNQTYQNNDSENDDNNDDEDNDPTPKGSPTRQRQEIRTNATSSKKKDRIITYKKQKVQVVISTTDEEDDTDDEFNALYQQYEEEEMRRGTTASECNADRDDDFEKENSDSTTTSITHNVKDIQFDSDSNKSFTSDLSETRTSTKRRRTDIKGKKPVRK